MTKTTYGGVCSATRPSRAVFQARSRARAAESASTLLWGLSPRVRLLQANRQYGRQQPYSRRPRVRWRGRDPRRCRTRRRPARRCGSWRSIMDAAMEARYPDPQCTHTSPVGTSSIRSASSCSGMLIAPVTWPSSYSSCWRTSSTVTSSWDQCGGQLGEVGDSVGPQWGPVGEVRHVADSRPGDVVDSDADQFASGRRRFGRGRRRSGSAVRPTV